MQGAWPLHLGKAFGHSLKSNMSLVSIHVITLAAKFGTGQLNSLFHKWPTVRLNCAAGYADSEDSWRRLYHSSSAYKHMCVASNASKFDARVQM